MFSTFTTQAAPAATTLTDIFKVPAGLYCTLKTLTVCNRGAADTFRFSVGCAGAADALMQYVYYDVALGANSTFLADFDMQFGEMDTFRVYSGAGSLSFMVTGTLTDGV
jgi:hypothetical protein